MRAFVLVLLGVLAGSILGCSTPPPVTGSHRLASVLLDERSSDRIEGAVEKVFKRESFELARRVDAKLVFERPGTFMNSLAYGDWYNGGVSERVEVFQKEVESNQTLLDCNAFMVQEPEDPFFEKVRPVSKGRRGRYQKLLEAVAEELKHPTGGAAGP
jgi:hypothetical protein